MARIIRFVKKYVFAAASCLYTFTLGVFSARARALLTSICKHFGYDPESVEPLLPEVDLADLTDREATVQIREPVAADGNISELELIVIAKLVRRAGPKALFEIGTFDGRTTLNMAANAPPEATVHTLDLPLEKLHETKLGLDAGERPYVAKEQSGARYLGTDCEEKITQHYGDSAEFDFSPFHGSVDFVFVDGSHARDYVKNDSEQALKMLRDGRGTIVWHDYDGWPGVTTALNQLYSTRREFLDLRHIRGTSLACLIVD